MCKGTNIQILENKMNVFMLNSSNLDYSYNDISET